MVGRRSTTIFAARWSGRSVVRPFAGSHGSTTPASHLRADMLLGVAAFNEQTHFIDLFLLGYLFDFLLQPFFQSCEETVLLFMELPIMLLLGLHFPFDLSEYLRHLVVGFQRLLHLIGPVTLMFLLRIVLYSRLIGFDLDEAGVVLRIKGGASRLAGSL